MRCLPIEHCDRCPHRDHRGGFGQIAYIPVCGATNRDLPYTLGAPGPSGRAHASYTKEIPEWCPLPEMPAEK